jgi:hypothetical protein
MKNPAIDNKRSRVCSTCIKKLIYAPRGHFMKAFNLIILKIFKYNIYLRLLCDYFMIRIMKVFHSQPFNNELQLKS